MSNLSIDKLTVSEKNTIYATFSAKKSFYIIWKISYLLELGITLLSNV